MLTTASEMWTHEDANSTTDQLQPPVSRALFILHEALEISGTKSDLLVDGWIDRPDEMTDSMHDVLMLVGGSTSSKSVHGAELSTLSELRADMMQKIHLAS